MSTRNVIGVAHGDGWRGVGLHHGGPPHDMGEALLNIYRIHNGNLPTMIRALITEHPHGWIDTDECACEAFGHDCRPDPDVVQYECSCPSPDTKCEAVSIEWAYVLTLAGIFIYKSVPAPDAPTTEQLLADSKAGRPINMESLMKFVHVPVGLVAWDDHDTMQTIGATEQ